MMLQFLPATNGPGEPIIPAMVVAHNNTGDGFRVLLFMIDGRTAFIDDPKIAGEEPIERPYCRPVPPFDPPRIIVSVHHPVN